MTSLTPPLPRYYNIFLIIIIIIRVDERVAYSRAFSIMFHYAFSVTGTLDTVIEHQQGHIRVSKSIDSLTQLDCAYEGYFFGR